MHFAGDSVTCTLEHPFFVNNDWVAAKDLVADDSLTVFSGIKVKLDSVYKFKTDTATAVYNLEAAGNHNYYVSASGVLVHNSCKMIFNEAVESNFKRFASKVPANAKSNIQRTILEDGTHLFEALSPAKNIPGSYAKYQKWVDKSGKTIKYLKTTVGPDGKIIHVKVK